VDGTDPDDGDCTDEPVPDELVPEELDPEVPEELAPEVPDEDDPELPDPDVLVEVPEDVPLFDEVEVDVARTGACEAVWATPATPATPPTASATVTVPIRRSPTVRVFAAP
jgi:hypothetical protein